MSNVQLLRGELRVPTENPSVNEINCYLFPEALLPGLWGGHIILGEVNQKHTLRSPLLPLVEFLFSELSKPKPWNLFFIHISLDRDAKEEVKSERRWRKEEERVIIKWRSNGE